MKVDGTDPLVLNKIQTRVNRQEVQGVAVSDSEAQVTGQKKAEQGKRPPLSDNLGLHELEVAVNQVNETVEALHLGIRFELHDRTQRYMVLIVDKVKNEVIKEIPPEKVLNLIGQIQEMIGLLLDEKR